MQAKEPFTESSLADALAAILDRGQVPLPGQTLRALAAALRAVPVPSERLARIAAFERERFVRSRRVPRLCVVLDEHGVELRPRVWARGEWRLARRIQTPDVVRSWEVGAGLLVLALLDEIVDAPPFLLELAHAHAQRAIRLFESVSAQELRMRLLEAQPGPGFAAHTTQQGTAERRLTREENFSGFDAYFGRTASELTLQAHSPNDLRPARPGEPGIAFADLVRERAEDTDVALDVIAFLGEWAAAERELDQGLSLEDYARVAGCTLDEARARQRRFRAVFPGQSDPSGIAAMLRRVAPSESFVRSLSSRFVDLHAAHREGDGIPMVVVKPAPVGWTVERDSERISEHLTQAEAVAEARTLAREEGIELRIHDRSGRLREANTYPRASALRTSGRGRDGGADAVMWDPSGTAVVVEFKSTNWDAIDPERVADNARRHARDLRAAAEQQQAAETVKAAVLQYAQRPISPGTAETVERVARAEACAVVWADERSQLR